MALLPPRALDGMRVPDLSRSLAGPIVCLPPFGPGA